MKKTLSLLLALALCCALWMPALAADDAPQRIVALPVWATEMLLELVPAERIVGISAYCDNPAVTYIAGGSGSVSVTSGADGAAEVHVQGGDASVDVGSAAEGLAEALMSGDAAAIGIIGGADGPTAVFVTGGASAAQVPNRVASNNAEGILTLAPDLVILDTFSDWDGALKQTLQDAGIKVIELESPTDFESIMARITDLGEAVGAPEEAAAMCEDITDRLNAVAERLEGLTEAERVSVMYYEDLYDTSGNSAGMLCAYGPGSTFDAIAAAAGCINVCDAENYSPVSKETLLVTWRPQMLIVSSSYMDENYVQHADGGQALIDAILADDTLQELPAVKEGKVYAIDDRARGSTSQYMVQAVEDLVELAYPDR